MKTSKQLLQECETKLEAIRSMLPVKEHSQRIAEIEEFMLRADFWNDQKKAKELSKERETLSSLLNQHKSIDSEGKFLLDYCNEFPDEIENNVAEQIKELHDKLSRFELSLMMTGEHDRGSAILTLTSGAGGIEACDWTAMLFRMYARFCDARGWKVSILDERPSAEYSDTCLDGITIQIDGEYAYGYLKNESTVVRLIRNSPFSSSDARHTSFAAVTVLPVIDDSIEIEIKDEDIDMSFQRGSGSGGQKVNKTSNCVRLHHLPSGIIIKTQSERSQSQNRATAFKLLRAKLYELELEKKNKEKESALSKLSVNKFGSQGRTFTLTPYSLVKDHRSNIEINNAERVLDGDLDEIIRSLFASN